MILKNIYLTFLYKEYKYRNSNLTKN